MSETMTPLERVVTAMGHQEPDRVPLFLTPNLHGARELGLSIQEYFSKPGNVVEGQIRLQEKFGHDCVTNYHYTPLEFEAWGGEAIFRDDGPVNSGAPLIRDMEQIATLEPPNPREEPCLRRLLEATKGLKERVGDRIPVAGAVTSPFSLPVMQLGFDRYIELIYTRRDLFDRLMAINEQFCVELANAQIEAGALAIAYVDPVSSPAIIPRNLYLETGHAVARRVLPRIKAGTTTHFASGRCLEILDDVIATGTGAVSASCEEDLCEMKRRCRGKVAIVGNLNGVTMRRWSAKEAEAQVKRAIAAAGRGGGFFLADNHGEIPWQVSDETMFAIAEATRQWGRYPLDWVSDGER